MNMVLGNNNNNNSGKLKEATTFNWKLTYTIPLRDLLDGLDSDAVENLINQLNVDVLTNKQCREILTTERNLRSQRLIDLLFDKANVHISKLFDAFKHLELDDFVKLTINECQFHFILH